MSRGFAARGFLMAAAMTVMISASPNAFGQPQSSEGAVKPPSPVRRGTDGKPDLSGMYVSDHGGANYGLEQHGGKTMLQATRGVIVDPADGKLPLQPWVQAEIESRHLAQRGYDDPTAHCFVGGIPRSMYVPAPMHILQPPGYVVILHERMSWRVVPLDGRPHLPDEIRLWQGDSTGRWDGDTLVIETRNLNGKSWLNEVGEVISHAETVIERLTPVDSDTITYEATITDPIVYTRPFTIRFPMRRQKDELLEIACHEDNQDLQHLKDIRDKARALSPSR